MSRPLLKPAHPADQWLTEPLRWRIVTRDGESMVKVSCAGGHVADLTEHIVAPDGKVTPSVVCPTPGCDWHEFVILQEWDARD